MRKLNSNPRVDNSDPANYPNGRIKDNSGVGDGTSVNERVYGDLHQMKEKLMLLYGIDPNNLPDNEINGYQLIDALIALASKNDYVLDMTTSGGVLQIPVKVALMKTGESLICKASADKTTETEIKGSDNSQTVVSFSGNFKANEYVRFIKTSGGVTLVRIGDSVSINSMVSELSYLKKASQSQENDGAVDTVATTPLVNKVTFQRRINGDDSDDYLASGSQNGLMSIAQFNILAGLVNKIKNTGGFSGLNIGSIPVSTNLPVFGNITQAQVTFNDVAGLTVVRCTFANNMDNTNYKVDSTFESQATFDPDSRVLPGVFKPVNVAYADIAFRESSGGSQNLKVHITVTQL